MRHITLIKADKIRRLLAEDAKLASIRKFEDQYWEGRLIATAKEQEDCVSRLRCDIWRQLRKLDPRRYY